MTWTEEDRGWDDEVPDGVEVVRMSPARARSRWTARVCARVAAVYLAWAVVALLWFQVDEGAVPPGSALPDLPASTSTSGEQVDCGSGGCSRTYDLGSGAEWTAAELVAIDRLTGCGLRSPITLRKACTYVTRSGDDVRLALSYQRPW